MEPVGLGQRLQKLSNCILYGKDLVEAAIEAGAIEIFGYKTHVCKLTNRKRRNVSVVKANSISVKRTTITCLDSISVPLYSLFRTPL